MDTATRVVLRAQEMQFAITRMTHEILEQVHRHQGVILLGLITRGVPLAERIAAIAAREGYELPCGQLDITMYRDDLRANPTRPVGRSHVPASIDDRAVVLIDDVLFSGRTVLAALHALADYGRPKAVHLAALVDRGGRQLPIQADVVGKFLPTGGDEHVRVQLAEVDGCDLVTIERRIRETSVEHQ